MIDYFTFSADVGRLTRALISNGETQSAKEIQAEFSKLLSEIYSCEPKIWMDTAVSGSGEDEDDHKFGPEATTADIIKNNSQPRPTTPPYHLLGTDKNLLFSILILKMSSLI
jgi:hypothetical protein